MKKQKEFSKIEIDRFVEEINSGAVTIKSLSCREGVSVHVMEKRIKKIYPHSNFKKNRINHNYFNTIGPNQAYILGLIASDGCVNSKRFGHRGNRWFIKLQEKDKKILELINLEIGRISGLTFERASASNRQNSFVLRASSEKMVEDLICLNITPRKSLTYKIHDSLLENHDIFFHFLRGMMDGDGSIFKTVSSKSKNTFNYTFSITGNEYSTQQISTFLFKNYNLGAGNISRKLNSKACSVIIRGNLQIKKLYELLYKDAELFLDRKHEKFLELVNQ